MLRAIVSFCVIACASSLASAQLIFQPVQYQYGNGSRFYYGGADPRVIARGLAETKGYCGQRGYSGTPILVYSDSIPTENARVYGASDVDAHNEAYQNATRYFRMRDVIATAVPQPDGTLLAPAQPEPAGPAYISITPSHGWHAPVEVPTATKAKPAVKSTSPVIVIPKEMLDRPVIRKKDLVASAAQ